MEVKFWLHILNVQFTMRLPLIHDQHYELTKIILLPHQSSDNNNIFKLLNIDNQFVAFNKPKYVCTF